MKFPSMCNDATYGIQNNNHSNYSLRLSEARFCYVVQAVLELTALVSQSVGAGISGSRYFVLPSFAI